MEKMPMESQKRNPAMQKTLQSQKRAFRDCNRTGPPICLYSSSAFRIDLSLDPRSYSLPPMGKSVTYAIGFAKAWPFADEIWEEKKRLKAALANDQKIDAAHASLEIADLLIAQCEDLESRNDHHDYDTDKFLEEALSYCDKARRTFTAEQHQAGLSRAYELMVQCYQRLCQYESAIAKGRSLLDLLQQQLGHNNPSLQAAFKSLADVYFKRGHDPSLSKFDDFENARSYYLKERALLDIMTAEDVDGDPLVLSDLIRSSNFNLGVIESKFPGGEQKAEEYLVLAVKQAQQLDDIENEKRAWWELGNVFRKQRNLERLLQCQKKELDLITTHDFKDDEIPCLVECGK
ncbi:uncharacterized protein BYT42DRAFT_362909 [Radiomyces spectabilis]|uniref:uncharacterized protein n=1 Tax=Radiomyces spectabilis TaxID=64574 RepID=UPI002220AC6F|nr:uncharacterized protein BYT42DRAFT_362909 [Radiomyces spectabilis]KAI8377956.1 hypothetical protein BYT42DRAFT_362909 [Radiomyces spectabilis]